MAKSAVSGPLYGAKSNLFTWGPYGDVHSTGASTGLISDGSTGVAPVSAVTVPPYEDWFVTEAYLQTSTNSSVAAGHAVYIKVEGGSTTVPPRMNGQISTNAATLCTMTSAAGSTTWSTWATCAITPPEYEGTYCPAGSSIRFVSSGITRMGGVQINLRGYTRFINSTRSEG